MRERAGISTGGPRDEGLIPVKLMEALLPPEAVHCEVVWSKAVARGEPIQAASIGRER